MRLFRISNLLSFAIAALFGVLLFWTSQAVQQKEDDLEILQKALVQEEETVRVLSVEWDYLNRPQRLEELANGQLGMNVPSVTEVVTAVDQVPEPALAVMEETSPLSGDVTLVPAVAVRNAKPAVATPISTVDYDTAYPVQNKPSDTISPAKAEKQSFEKLIETLDGEGAQ